MLDELIDELLEHRREAGDLMDRSIDAITILVGKIDIEEEKNALLLQRVRSLEDAHYRGGHEEEESFQPCRT